MYLLYNPGMIGFLLKKDKAITKCSGIINLLSVFWSKIRADILLIKCNSKYPSASSTKTPNKMYIFNCEGHRHLLKLLNKYSPTLTVTYDLVFRNELLMRSLTHWILTVGLFHNDI